jgi:hypothetical protein
MQGCGTGASLATLPVRYRMADVGRFERDDTDASHLPETLGVATEGLRSTIESEVARIVANAEARAAEIEDQALEKATRVEQNSERRLETAFEDSRHRLMRMLSQIDAAERSFGESVQSLRSEAQQLTGDLGRASTEPFGEEEPPPPPPMVAQTAAPEVEATAVEAPPEPEPEPEAPSGPVAIPDPQIRGLIRQQLLNLAEGGRTRADAERMLLRFRQGEQYFDLLDEIYPDSTPGRRGLLRRRKD